MDEHICGVAKDDKKEWEDGSTDESKDLEGVKASNLELTTPLQRSRVSVLSRYLYSSPSPT